LRSIPSRRCARRRTRTASWPWLKVKLGGGADDRDRLAAVHAAAPGAQLLVDANGGWSRAELERYAVDFAGLGVGVIEQPLPPGADRSLADWNGPLPSAPMNPVRTGRVSRNCPAAIA
jgi:L-alanine-DL-glutamate epimerase-like enolase superfamily enzyme